MAEGTNNLPGYLTSTVGARWSAECFLAAGYARSLNWSFSPLLMINDDNSATVAWMLRSYDQTSQWISCARVVPGDPPVVVSINDPALAVPATGFGNFAQSFRMGDNLVMLNLLQVPSFTWYVTMFDADGGLIQNTTFANPFSFFNRWMKLDETHLLGYDGKFWVMEITSTSIGTPVIIDADPETTLGAAYFGIYDATYSPDVGSGLVFSYNDWNGSYYELIARPYTCNGSSIQPLGSWVGCGDQNLSDEWAGSTDADHAPDGGGAILSTSFGGFAPDYFDARLYRFDQDGVMVGYADPGAGVIMSGGGASRFFHAVNGSSDVIWVDQFYGDLHFVDEFFTVDSTFAASQGIVAELNYDNFYFYYLHDGASNGVISWMVYNMQQPSPVQYSEYLGIRCTAGAIPDLDGELVENRRKFARGPTDYTM